MAPPRLTLTREVHMARRARATSTATAPPSNYLVGTWVTSFDLQFPDQVEVPVHFPFLPVSNLTFTSTTWIPIAFLSCFVFLDNFTFTLDQSRNRYGFPDRKPNRSGTYSIGWISGVPGGEIVLEGNTGNTPMTFLMRNIDEMHFLLGSSPFTEPLGPQPIAQGTMYRVDPTLLSP